MVLVNSLYKRVNCKTTTSQRLWIPLERKYKTEDAGTNKFMVAAIIEKLPLSWVEFKNYLKHTRKKMSVEDLVVRLRIEEDHKISSKNTIHLILPRIIMRVNPRLANMDMIAMVSDVIAMISEVNLVAINNGETLYMGNSATTDIKGEGDVILKMISEKELKLTNSDKFVLSKNQMYVGKGYAVNGMFNLNVVVVMNDINKMNSFAYLIDSSHMWHGRLGHKTKVENQLDRKIKVVRSDRGDEYVSPFAELCVKHGIRHEFTAPYSPQQNGIAERKNRTLKEMVNAMLISSGLSQDMWGEAILTATYILNKIPPKVVVPTPKAQKIRPKSMDCIFIGYAKNNIAYRFIIHDSKNSDIQKNAAMESRNASFFENIFPYERQDHPEEEEVEPRRSKRARTEKSLGPDFVSFMVENEPTSYREAVTSSEGHQWKEAIKSEID
ncbi:retrotransposon protein, putative, ty1-copia subclass [Tanacetum coccineum]